MHMRFFGNGLAALPVTLVLLSGTAHAALTADQVWQSWKDAAAAVGLTVTAATEANSGGVLSLNGISIAPEGMTTGFTISDMTLTEGSDGSVTIVPGTAIGLDASEGDSKVLVSIVQDGLQLVASEGADGALAYAYQANALSVEFDAAMPATNFDGTPGGTSVNKGKVGFEGLAGTYNDAPGANRTLGFDLTAAKLIYDIDSEDPVLKMNTKSVSSTDDVAIGLDMTMPSAIALTAIASATDFGTALQEGLGGVLSMTQGVTQGSASAQDEFFPYSMTMTTQPGKADMVFNKDTFSMTSQAGGLELDMTTPMMPVPVKVQAGGVEVNLTSPVMAGAAAGDYGFKMALSQLSVSEEAWALFDPTGALDHGPADLLIDVGGKAMIDFVSLIAAEESGAVPPTPAPETLDIRALSLKIAGAALSGSGSFTFDNSAGIPMPLGTADLSLTGGNALIDGLIATGIVSEEDAMGARMMMGAFMTPGAEPDSLTTQVEAKPGGEIYVNGQRVQ